MSTLSATVDTRPAQPLHNARASHPVRSFIALLRRELRQHRGALIYTPLIVAGIVVILSILGMITGEGFRVRFGHNTPEFSSLVNLIGSQGMEPQRILFFRGVFFGTFSLFHSCLFIVVLLYCLGALYDERKDRSILFWKSMPVSDTRTVLSKLATATLVAPAIMLVVVAITWFVLLCLFSILVWRYDGNPWTMVWSSASTLSMLLRAGWLELVNALWLLPIFGWVLFCSGWSRVRPFLWAFLVPFWLIVLGKWITTTSIARLGLDTVADWLLLRLSAGVLPLGPGHNLGRVRGIAAVEMSPGTIAESLAWPSMWIGVAIGAAMITLTIYWRRYRDDSL